VHGQATDEVDERGRPIRGDTLLLLMNAHGRSRLFHLPAMDEPGVWRQVVNTARAGVRPAGAPGVTLVGHSLVLLSFAARGAVERAERETRAERARGR
jgi:glycogen operon protein